MSYFVPPCNYGMVEHDLSRSGQCHQLIFPFLERLNLKTVIYLSHDEPSQPLYALYFPWPLAIVLWVIHGSSHTHDAPINSAWRAAGVLGEFISGRIGTFECKASRSDQTQLSFCFILLMHESRRTVGYLKLSLSASIWQLIP
jgi:hypothetical protein